MMKQVTKRAYAKINLFLEVKGKRSDGYHEIDSVMQTVNLYDLVTVCYDEDGSGISVVTDKKYLPTDRNNIAYRAAELFLKESGVSGGVGVHILKKIPVAAGLGGGSADGAAVLAALNELTGRNYTTERLCAIGKKIGADIPFCLRGGTVRAEGIGEVLTDLPCQKKWHTVIAMGNEGSSTPMAYKALDDLKYKAEKNADELIECLKKGENIKGKLYNAFERVIFLQNAGARTLKELFYELGSEEALMSGSGAAVFGLFSSEEKAKKAMHILRSKNFFAVLA